MQYTDRTTYASPQRLLAELGSYSVEGLALDLSDLNFESRGLA